MTSRPGAGRAQDRLQRADRRQTVIVPARDGKQRFARRRVAGRAGQDALVAPDRPLDVAQVGLGDAGRPEGELVARGGRLGQGRPGVEHVDQIGVALLGGQDAIEVRERLDVTRRLFQHLAQLADRLLGLGELGLVEPRAGHAQHPPLFGPLGQLQLARIDVDQLAVRPGAEVQLRQRLQRVAVGRVDLEDRLPGPHRLLGLLERVFVQHGDPLGHRLALADGGGDLRGASRGSRPARPTGTPLRTAARAPGRRPDSSGRVASAVRQASIASRGLAQRILEQPGRHRPQLRLHVRIADLERPLLERRDQLCVQPRTEAQRLHLGEGIVRLDVGQPGPAPAVERQVAPPEALMDLGHLAQDPHALGAVVDRLELGVQRPDQLLQVVRAAVDRLQRDGDLEALDPGAGQRLERRDRLAVIRGPRQDLGVTVDGRGRILQPRLQRLGRGAS